jgi:hypothetical protein
VTPDGTNTAVISMLTIATDVSTASAATPVPPGRQGQSNEKLLALLLFGLPGLIWARRKLGRGYAARILTLICGIALGTAATAIISCGGGAMSTNTPKGTDTVIVSASSGSSSQTANLMLTIQ